MVFQNKKPIIGVLGGIASGKSVVAKEFAQLGCAVIDADSMVHEMFLDISIKNEIRTIFGQAAFDQAGEIDRKALGSITFDDGVMLRKLNSILHPKVIAKTEQLLEEYQASDEIKAVVLDVPLLMEIGWDSKCDVLVFVDLDEQTRIERALKRSFKSVEQLKKRENFQISLDKKREKADYIISNNSDISATARQVAEILSKILTGNV